MKRFKNFSAWVLTVLLAATATYFFFPHELNAQKGPVLKFGDPMPMNLYIELGKAVNPAVVNISTTQKVRGRMPMNPQMQNDPFWEFFEQFNGADMGQTQAVQALGTGFIIEDDGLIVTNAHVVNEAQEIQVQLVGDKKLYEATLVGKDERADIALIKIKPNKKVPIVFLGDSDKVEVGEWVAAFGNPFGHTNSMSKGIISAKGRELEELNAYPFLQTDANINPGNSGGPLVNTKGEVIGVNTAIDARAQGIGFAIPIDAVKNLLPQLKTTGHVTHGFLGVGLADIDPRGAAQLGLKSDEGALIVSVSPGSPAANAGFEVYDFVTKFNDRDVTSGHDLMNAVLDAPVGKPVTADVVRKGKNIKLNITLHEKESRVSKQAKINGDKGGQVAPHALGFKVDRLTQRLALTFNMAYIAEQPPVVTYVEPKSPALKAGLHLGDIILDVNQKPVHDVKDVMSTLTDKANTLRISRGGGTSLIFINK